MFVVHFTDVSHCNDFSLAQDDGRWPAYNDALLQIYRLSRCKLSVVRRRRQPCLSLAHTIRQLGVT